MPSKWNLQGLAVIRLKVEVRTKDNTSIDYLLYTNSGNSGPAVLQLSCYWHANNPIQINFLPQLSLGQALDAPEHGKLLVRTLVSRHMPQRLADALLPPALARRKVAELSRMARNEIAECVHQHNIVPTGTGGLKKAEAARGGVSTDEVNAWSMESLREPGLYIIGEMLDITGHLGGYNLHWAWASGHMAGLQI